MNSFKQFFKSEESKDYYKQLMKFVEQEYATATIYPKKMDLFKALELCPLNEVKVVILGQDPYINENQAHGLAFSILNQKITPTLRNIFKELYNDLGIERNNTCLEDWAKSGVMLLNTIFTVRAHESLSHANKGWEKFSINLLKFIDTNITNCIFVLWGSYAQQYEKYLDSDLIIKSSHPSPLSAYRTFFGSKPFSKCNDMLLSVGKDIINW